MQGLVFFTFLLAIVTAQNFNGRQQFPQLQRRQGRQFFNNDQQRPVQFVQQDRNFQRQNQQFLRGQQQIVDQQFRRPPQQFNNNNFRQQQFRPLQSRPVQFNNQQNAFNNQQQFNRVQNFNNNNNQLKINQGQFRPSQQQLIQAATPKPEKKKKAEVDPATLNPPTEDNPSPTNDQGRRFVAQPELKKCQNRVIHARQGRHGYYFSWLDAKAVEKEYDWLDARNYCRQRCMDSISIETPEEDAFMQKHFMDGYRQGLVSHVWTSGRVCDFDGCDREDLQPIRVNGWFFPATGQSVVLRNNTSKYSGWSTRSRFAGQGQPDNAEGTENCIALLNPDLYKEVDNLPHWHDVKCQYRKKMMCEDNDNLLGYIRQQNPGVQVL